VFVAPPPEYGSILTPTSSGVLLASKNEARIPLGPGEFDRGNSVAPRQPPRPSRTNGSGEGRSPAGPAGARGGGARPRRVGFLPLTPCVYPGLGGGGGRLADDVRRRARSGRRRRVGQDSVRTGVAGHQHGQGHEPRHRGHPARIFTGGQGRGSRGVCRVF
jgi:hypothetical protein